MLLTLTLASGMLFSEQIFGRPMLFTHRNVFSLLGWLTFGALLWGRWRYGWRGRVALRWIVAGTVFVFLAYLGRSSCSRCCSGGERNAWMTFRSARSRSP